MFLADDGLWVLKFARNHGFVPAVDGAGMLVMRQGTAQEYLERQVLNERIFPTGLHLRGLTDDGHFVIAQRAISGGHPTEAAIRKYLLKLGFANLPARFGQAGGAWFHRDLEVLIMDTAPDNFISAKQGIVPIDLQITELSGKFQTLANAADDLARQAPGTPRTPPPP